MAPPSARVGGSRCSGYSRTWAGEWEALNAPSAGDPLMLCSDWWTRMSSLPSDWHGHVAADRGHDGVWPGHGGAAVLLGLIVSHFTHYRCPEK